MGFTYEYSVKNKITSDLVASFTKFIASVRDFLSAVVLLAPSTVPGNRNLIHFLVNA